MKFNKSFLKGHQRLFHSRLIQSELKLNTSNVTRALPPTQGHPVGFSIPDGHTSGGVPLFPSL